MHMAAVAPVDVSSWGRAAVSFRAFLRYEMKCFTRANSRRELIIAVMETKQRDGEHDMPAQIVYTIVCALCLFSPDSVCM